jgi:sterol desaturase/sphingolipid hydroxylase (fatty acid hydroxylase superfamily)
MDTIVGISEPLLRFGAFAGVFAVMGLLEIAIPKRVLRVSKGRRWFNNLAIIGIDGLVVRAMSLAIVPLTAVAASIYCEKQQIGLFNLTGLAPWLEIVLAILLLDLAIWLQHLVSHKVPLLWRIHQMHHCDLDFDVTTALRFHPVEIVLSTLYKIVLVFMLGPSAAAVVLFEIILNGTAMFNHANIKLPLALDRIIRLFLVTPDMHRIHHSVVGSEYNSNFGFALSIWDRALGTYTSQPRDGHDAMRIGLPAYQHEGPVSLGWLLMLPLAGAPENTTSTTSKK